MASNSTPEYRILADQILSPDEDIIVKVAGAMYKGSIEEPNRYTTVGDLSGLTGGSALNYVQVAADQVTVNSSPQELVSLSITTTGAPVQINLTGEGSNAATSAWVKVALHRDGTLIGQTIQIESSAISENVPYALNFIDDVAAGTYVYSAKIVGKSSGNWQFGEVSGPILNAVELTGFKGDAGSANLVLPVAIKDDADADFITFTKTGTGTARIETLQDDLSLRSARDITLYAGNDGPGEVYIGWGDAVYTPNSPNRVATVGYVDDVTGANAVKYVVWGYPSNDAIAIMPATDNESIALKSSDSAAIRWHIRNIVDLSISPTSAAVTQGDGNYQVVFTIPEQTSVPPTGEYYYHIYCPNNSAYDASLYAVSATTTSITFYYPTDPGEFDPSGAYVNLPSVYAQYQVDSDGAHIKVANWTSDQGSYSKQWTFTKEGGINFPYQTSNSRTGYGDVLQFAPSADQAIITGAPATPSNPTANRLVIAGQDGSTNGEGGDGEGGDIYVWAGQGGGTTGDGGDVKIDGGNGGTQSGNGGYVKVRGGYSQASTGGFLELSAGNSYNGNGGNININAGDNLNFNESIGGNVTIRGGSSADPLLGGSIDLTTYQSGKITLSGAGGEFLNDPANPNNQIATIGDIQSNGSWDALFTDATGTLAGHTYTGNYNRVGNMIFFCVNVDFAAYTNLGTGQYQFTLPFAARQTFTSRAGTLHNHATDTLYHIASVADINEPGGGNVAKLYYSGSTTDLAWKYNTPVSWASTQTHFDISGFYEIEL